MYSPDDFDTFGIKTTTRPFPSWRMNNYFVHQHSQHLVFFRRACAIPLLLNAFGIGPWGQVGKILRDVLNGIESVRRFDESGCGQRKVSLVVLGATSIVVVARDHLAAKVLLNLLCVVELILQLLPLANYLAGPVLRSEGRDHRIAGLLWFPITHSPRFHVTPGFYNDPRS